MVEEEGLIFRRHKEWLEGIGVNFPNNNKCTPSDVQSSSRNSLSDGEPVYHNIKVLVNEKEMNIIVTDKNLGEKLESFLNKHNFANFIMASNKEVKYKSKSPDRIIKTTPTPVVFPEKVPVNQKHRIVYDRDFLLKFRSHNYPTLHVIAAIQKNHMHLFR